MNPVTHILLDWLDWLSLFQQYLMLSLLSIGGAMTTLPEMHRFLIVQNHWLTEAQFNASIAIAQAAPGPNVLFIALLAWNVGMNTGSAAAGLFSTFVVMTGVLIPSSALTYWVSGWLHRNTALCAVHAFKQGLAPVIIALLIATGWIMASVHPFTEWKLWSVTIVTVLLLWRTKLHMMWLISAGALLGWFGFI